MKKIILATCLMVVMAGVVYAEDSFSRERNWGFGWDNGLTLRRNIGLWQVGVSGGPDDYLEDSTTHISGNVFPDSLQGFMTEENSRKEESGFVRLDVARLVTQYQNFQVHGVMEGRYSWLDYQRSQLRYRQSSENWYENRDDRFTKRYSLSLGIRLTWFPLDFFSFEYDMGLVYSWMDYEDKDFDRDFADEEWDQYTRDSSSQGFDDYGSNDILHSLKAFIWF